MKIFKGELTMSVDVDNTLLMWEEEPYKPGKGKIKVIDPNDGNARYLVPHQRHVNFVRKCAKRGYQITVWSAGGWAWAEAAVRALKLEDYVTKIETKPVKFIDDLEAHEILGTRIFLPNTEGSD